MTGPRHADRPSHTEGSPLNPDTLEVAPGTVHESVQGWVPKLATEEELRVALEKAFDYRGDVTGRDTAAGKSWEAWVGKYWEKKASGEGVLTLEPESLD